ncbi:hypothetical protein MVEN_01134700 [Mycena venus]|uniref:Uncharacterized protein n=1 Tax=Mycena venus TaxID=2733690 RepID=A0A8H6Y9S8_9AGAR|nr:hypothetical protein MVEN_01134700 [Mycena venus]
MADTLHITTMAALRHAEHTSVVACNCADTITELRRAVQVLREENELLQTDFISACGRELSCKSKVDELEVALAEEKTRTRDAEKALREKHEGVPWNLAHVTESMGEMGSQHRLRSAQVLSESSAPFPPTPKPRAMARDNKLFRPKLRPRVGAGAPSPSFKSHAVHPPNHTSTRTHEVKRRRLSPALTPEPEFEVEPGDSLRVLEHDIQAFSERTSLPFPSRNGAQADARELLALSEALLRRAEAM